MKKTIITFIAFILYTGFLKAQKDKIIGNWLVTQIEVDGKIESAYQGVEFSEDGKMIMMGMELATWDYNKKSNEIIMKSDLEKDFNGVVKILSLTKKGMIIEKDDTKVTYQKVDLKKITKENEASGLSGTWKLKNNKNPETNTFISFKTPYKLSYAVNNKNYQQKGGAMWVFNKTDKTLSMIGFYDVNIPEGESNILKLEGNNLKLEHKGIIYSLTKEKTQTPERLTFTQEDFYTEEGDYIYENEEQKLPWYQLSVYGMRNTYATINQVTYNYKTLIEGMQSFESKTLTANMIVNFEVDEIAISFDYIFNGYDSYNLPEDYSLPPNKYDYYNNLFPYEDISFRVTSNEKISVPAGSFDCTVLEGLGSSEEMVKLWMIDDKPGIYAKIIQDKPGQFGYYHIYELQKIKYQQ